VFTSPPPPNLKSLLTQLECLVFTLKVIEGGKDALEEKILEDMFQGKVCPSDLDRLRPRGRLHLVKNDSRPVSKSRIPLPLDWMEDKTN